MATTANSALHSFPHLPGYTLIEQLYQSSRTKVYRAVQHESQQSVVIKLLQQSHPSFRELIQFRNQYTIAKDLSLSGLVQPLCLEPWQNSYALVMEDVGGLSLKDYAQHQPLTLVEGLAIALQMADILNGLCQHRVVHKDIKPANILIQPASKQIKLIDFSIASRLPKETQQTQAPRGLEGTLAYLAPEQTGRMNRGIDYRTDFYGLGITLYELLSGELPFPSKDPLELVHCHIAQPPVPLHQVNPAIPPMVSSLVLKLMAKNAEDRYQSALGLKHDLEHCLHQWQKAGTIPEFDLGQGDISDRFLIPEKLYGREQAVQTLLDTFNRVVKGNSELMLIAGFSGIGKTAVINEVHKPITRQKGYFIKGKFDQFNRNIPLSAFVQALRDLMVTLLSESDTQLVQWKRKILAAVGENGQVLIEVIPELERIIDPQPPVSELTGTAAQNRFNLLFQKFIRIFTTAEHPLVMFLDDLQWADAASLQLIKRLMSSQGHLLLLGAYRDNEVSPAHPLMLVIEDLKPIGTVVNTITLLPLTFSDTNQLIADTLRWSTTQSQPLTQLIFSKTQGNPFFITQFLKALHEDGHIVFNQNQRCWECEIDQISTLSLTDNVLDFIVQQLKKLPSETQAVLTLAACIGNRFNLETLAIIADQSLITVANLLWEALQESFILPTSQTYQLFQNSQIETPTDIDQSINLSYQFLHDRIQQAAYSLIPEAERQQTHLQIGRLLWQNASAEEHLFEILNHLNESATLITEDNERRALRQLNLTGCQRAKFTTAYDSALQYAKAAMDLLPPNPWQKEYPFALALYEAAAESAYLNTDFDAAEALIQSVLTHVHHLTDGIKAYELLIQVYISKDQQLQAIETGLEALNQLGVTLVQPTDWSAHLPTLPQTQTLATRPAMSNPAHLAALRILITITPPTHHVKPQLFPAVVLTMMQLCEQGGLSSLAAYAYGIYGLLLCALIEDLDAAHRSGQLSLLLLEQFHARELRTKVNMLFAVFVCACKEAGQATLPLLKQGIEIGFETGDIEYVSYCIMAYFSNLFLVGEPLEAIESAQQTYIQTLEQFKQEHCIEYSKLWLQAADTLMGYEISETSTASVLEHFQNTHNHQCLFAFHLAKLTTNYIFGNYQLALNHGVKALESQAAAFGILLTAAHQFYYTLTLIKTLDHGLEPDLHAATIAQIQTNQTKLEALSAHAPGNYQHKLDLVIAEYHRVMGQKLEAMEQYDRAISGAQENGYRQEEALANELAAQFYLDWGKVKIATVYLQEAYYKYAQWGAKAKVEDLEKRYPHLLQPILQQTSKTLDPLVTLATMIDPKATNISAKSTSRSSSSRINTALDFAAVLKASQALSGTIQLDKLLHQLSQIILHNSGGDRCVLILPNREGQWCVQAIATPETIELRSEAIDTHSALPIKLIQYVKNTQTAVTFDELQTDLPVIDHHLEQQPPKSALCLPILNQGKLIGILYLKSQSTRGLFTTDRISILNFLCAQAAISLENARLFSESQESEAALHQSQARLQKLSNNLPGLIYQFKVDAKGNPSFPFVSKRSHEFFALSPAQLQQNANTVIQQIEPTDMEQFQASLATSTQTLETFSWVGRFNLPKGQQRWVDAKAVPERQPDGSVIWDGVMLDITDRKRAEEIVIQKSQELELALENLQNTQLQMVQSEKMASLGNLVAGVAHEINNPLGFLKGSVNNAKDYIRDLLEHIQLYQQHHPNAASAIQDNADHIDLDFLVDDLPKLLDSMATATERIKNISTSLRTFSRADTDYKVSANLHDGLDSTLLILKYRLKANEHRPAIQIIKSYQPIPPVKCFPGQLNQVFTNILANAIDMFDEVAQTSTYTAVESNPPIITIRTLVLTEQNTIKICISDNGKGMTEDIKAHIFDHLFTTKAIGKGTGLGLAIARQIIIETHNGNLEVTSALGEGSEFCISLPISTLDQ